MRHAWYRRRFSRALDGDLSPRGQKRLQEHLEHCAGCRTAFAELRDTVRLLHDFAAVKPPATDLSAQIMARISAAPAPWYGRLAPPAPALLPALGAALALAVVVFWPLPGDPGGQGRAGRAGNSAPVLQTTAAPSPPADAAVQVAERRAPVLQTAAAPSPPAEVATQIAAAPSAVARLESGAELSPVASSPGVPAALAFTTGGVGEVEGAPSGLVPADGPPPKPLSPARVRPVATGAQARRALPTPSSGPAMAFGAAQGTAPIFGSALATAPRLRVQQQQHWLETALQQPLSLVERLERIRDDARRERVVEGLARFAAEHGISQQLAEKLRATEDARALKLAERFETPEGAPGETPPATP